MMIKGVAWSLYKLSIADFQKKDFEHRYYLEE